MSFLNVSKLTGIPNRLGEYNMEMTFDEALEVLIKKGVISSPDYWVMCAKTTLYIKELIINMAKALKYPLLNQRVLKIRQTAQITAKGDRFTR